MGRSSCSCHHRDAECTEKRPYKQKTAFSLCPPRLCGDTLQHLRTFAMNRLPVVLIGMAIATGIAFSAQAPQAPANKLGDGPWNYTTSERNTRIKVSVVTKGLSHPWSIVWLPNGDMLVTERAGRLRIIRNGVLDPEPVKGVPKVQA